MLFEFLETFASQIRLTIKKFIKPKSYKLTSLEQYKILNGFINFLIKVLLLLTQMFLRIQITC